MIKVSIIIVNWNSFNLITKCLSSIKQNNFSKNYQIYVVDNASTDRSVEILQKKFPWVKLVVNKENLGFAKANNQVLKKIKSEYVFILNPDTIVLKNTINILMDFMDKNPHIAACGPILLNPDKTIQRKGYYHKFPNIPQVFLFYTQLYYKSIKNKFLVRNFWEDIETKKSQEVDQIPGACIFARMKILKKVNFFDEDYPLWFEDVDLCFKLKKKGYKLMLVPDSKLIHYGGGSFKKWHDDIAKQARFYKSLFLFFEKNSNYIITILAKLIIIFNFFYLIFSRGIKQILTPTKNRKVFIFSKIRTLQWILQ